MRLVEDLQTGLVRNAAFRPELMTYDSEYDNEQATSACFREHLRNVSEIVAAQFGSADFIEIGSGKGQFLELLLSKGCSVAGFDPSYDGDNPRIRKEYFQPACLDPCAGFVLRHVLEHVPDPYKFLQMLCDANGRAGKIYIEVPCFDWICEHKAWFDVFYEHVNYFRMVDFHRMFETVQIAERSFGGQYLSIVADLSTLRVPDYSQAYAVRFPKDTFDQRVTPSAGSVIWGGGSKGVTFAVLIERAGHKLEFAIDINPRKQGKYLPVTGLKVRSPEDAFAKLRDGSTIYVMNSRYLEEIKRMSDNRFCYALVEA